MSVPIYYYSISSAGYGRWTSALKENNLSMGVVVQVMGSDIGERVSTHQGRPLGDGLYLHHLRCEEVSACIDKSAWFQAPGHIVYGFSHFFLQPMLLMNELNGYNAWTNSCRANNVSMGVVVQVTGSESKMTITKGIAGPFI